MKLWIKILFSGIIVFALLFTAIYLFLVFQGKALIIKQLEGLTQKKASIGYFGITPPLNLQVKNLDIEGLAKVESVSISPSILGLLMGSIALNEVKVVKPEFTFERVSPPLTDSPVPSSSPESVSVTPAAPTPAPTITLTEKPAKKAPLRLVFKHINIKDGRIDFVDRTVGQDGIKITVKDIYFNLTNLYSFPRSVITNFELKGRMPWQKDSEEGKIEAEGWLNLFKKDMQANLKVLDIDGVYFYPYYSGWVDLEKARIEKAKLNFTSNINGLNNNIVAECHLELTDIIRKERPPEQEEDKAAKITDVVLDIFRVLNQGKIVLDFTIRTRMDRPEFGFGNIKMAFEDKLAQGKKMGGFNVQDVLMLPTNLLQGAVKGATDLSKAVIDGTFSVGKELRKAVEDTFKKEKKESP